MVSTSLTMFERMRSTVDAVFLAILGFSVSTHFSATVSTFPSIASKLLADISPPFKATGTVQDLVNEVQFNRYSHNVSGWTEASLSQSI